MSLVGLDMNATQLRAVRGPTDMPPASCPFGTNGETVVLAISLRGRTPEVGRAGAALIREYPHLVCFDFLAHLGNDRTWSAGRHHLDAAKAVTLVWEHLRPVLATAQAVTLALPAYLTPAQAGQVLQLAHKAKVPIHGSTTDSLASGLAGYQRQRWSGFALLVDVDDHALSWTLLKTAQEQLQVVEYKAEQRLSLLVWKKKLVDAIADLCIQHSRRDPRDSGAAEQLLFDQLDDVFAAVELDRMVEVVIRSTNWCQNLMMQPQQIRQFCGPLVDQARDGIEETLEKAAVRNVGALLLTHAAGRLPGLAASLQDVVDEKTPLVQLPADAAARMAWALGARFARDQLPGGHLHRSLALSIASIPEGETASTRTNPRRAADR